MSGEKCMARLFPLRSETPAREGPPRIVDLADEDADAVFGALSSSTAREIYTVLDENPGTPSDIAEAIDSSIQNVRYHLEKLEGAGLVEVVDTWYSSRGNEMSVYATSDGPLIVTSDETRANQLKTALSRFLGGIAALAGGSLLLQYGLGRYFTPERSEEVVAPPDDDAAVTVDEPEEDDTEDEVDIATEEPDEEMEEDIEEEAPEEEPDVAEEPVEEVEEDVAYDYDVEDTAEVDPEIVPDDGYVVVETAPSTAETIFSTIPPGLLFFLGGLVVLTGVMAWWYWRTY